MARLYPNNSNTKTHLGNTKVLYAWENASNSLDVLQTSNYYPFGMQFDGAASQQTEENHYLYNGKELQNDNGVRRISESEFWKLERKRSVSDFDKPKRMQIFSGEYFRAPYWYFVKYFFWNIHEGKV